MTGTKDGGRLLTVLHTNDFHNRLSASAVARIETVYAGTPDPKLLLDAGDAGGSTNITFRMSGEPILEEMSRIGYRAMTVGNRDFHVSRLGFRSKVGMARFPILCANVRPAGSSEPSASDEISERPLDGSVHTEEPELRSYVVCEPGGVKVLIFGLTVPMITERMWERKLSAYIFDPPIRTASRLVPVLRRKFSPRVVVALTHIGTRLDRELAERVPGIDLIVGGHSHDLMPDGERVGDTLLVQAGSHGKYMGIVTVVEDAQTPSGLRLDARIEAL